MENLNAPAKYYNLAGKYTESEKGFKKYMKRELNFYRNLNKLVVENRANMVLE